MRTIYTVGYEGRSLEEMVDHLREREVDLVIDVRIRAQSRKRGFSKTALATGLREMGIDYTHIRALGTPLEMLRAVRASGVYDWVGYRAYMLSQREALADAEELCMQKRSTLLCYEANPNECHRIIVAEHLAKKIGAVVDHLRVEPSPGSHRGALGRRSRASVQQGERATA